MNSTTASCGHAVIAIGAPGTPARLAVESQPCRGCKEKLIRQEALKVLTKAEACEGHDDPKIQKAGKLIVDFVNATVDYAAVALDVQEVKRELWEKRRQIRKARREEG